MHLPASAFVKILYFSPVTMTMMQLWVFSYSSHSRKGLYLRSYSSSGWTWAMLLQRYGTFWRDTRRVLQRQMNPQIVTRYRPIEMKSAHEFLQNLLATPENFFEHIKRSVTFHVVCSQNSFCSRIIGRQALYTAYGVDVQERGDTMIKTAEHAHEAVVASMTPGQFLVDMIPIRA